MTPIRVLLLLVVALGLSACGKKTKFLTYYGPEITQVQVHKADRKMYLIHQDKVIADYDVALGFAPEGHKQFEGDGKTPEGAYYITHHNPKSRYHLSLGISYPNAAQVEAAKAAGKKPGGDIFIHGQPNGRKGQPVLRRDWTAGCIAVSDPEIEELWRAVAIGTEVELRP